MRSSEEIIMICKVWCTDAAWYGGHGLINAYYFSPKSQWIMFHAVEHGKQVALNKASKHLPVN